MGDQKKDEPSLELPSLAMRWRRSKDEQPLPAGTEPRPHDEEPAAREPAPAEPDDTAPATEPVDSAPVVEAPVAAEPEPVAAETTTQTLPPVEDHEPVAMETSAAHAAAEGSEPTRAASPGVPRQERERRLPTLSGPAAAAFTGLLVGLLTVGLTVASLHLCTVLRGTSTCGNPGVLLLVVILAVMIVLGGAMLRAWEVPEPGSTSFLGVGLMTAVALIFLLGSLQQWWMVIALPLVAAATFLASRWVTSTFTEPGDRPR